ncbi:MAG TPA: hypothetical protein VEJ86_04835 [Candidatus Binataceae bacterium]|nr:hypothetical protein [Candidatus Binataceae bacterium]
MTAQFRGCRIGLVGILLAALTLIPARARAIEVKKMLPTEGGGESQGGGAAPSRANPIPAAARAQLGDIVSQESDQYLDAESEKKSSGAPYADLEHAKFTYTPSQKAGKWTVLAKLEANEYKGSKDPSAKPHPTGKKKALVFNYRLDGSKWTEVEPPKWEDETATTTAAKK